MSTSMMYADDGPTTLYKVSFTCCKNSENRPLGNRKSNTLETYYFDDRQDAELCKNALARQRLQDTYTLAMRKHGFEMLKRRHHSTKKQQAYDHTRRIEIDTAYQNAVFCNGPYLWGEKTCQYHV